MNIVSFVIGIGILVFVLKILSLPMRIIMKFVINSIIGLIILGVLSFMGIGIVIYWWTVLLTGLLGIPGLVIAGIITILM